MKSLCIIPARGGSKRIPRKNLKSFCGKPIIAYSIQTAINSGLFEEVMVSTDDFEIAEIAQTYGAKVPFFRSVNNSDDFATTSNVLEEVLYEYKKRGQYYESACCIYPTAPFITINSLNEGKRILDDEGVDSVFPVVKFDYPIWRGLKKNKTGRVEMIWDEHLDSRSQDMVEVFHDAGQWYWFDVNVFLKNKKLFTNNTKSVELSSLEVQDIDNLYDWYLAELKYAYLQNSQ